MKTRSLKILGAVGNLVATAACPLVAVLFMSLLISVTWVQFVSAQTLNNHPGNVRTLYREFGRERGPLGRVAAALRLDP